MKTITITNQKGGVGKTTTALALASGLAHKGYRVLGIDLDPQENLSYSTGASDNENNIYALLTGKIEFRPPLKKEMVTLKKEVDPLKKSEIPHLKKGKQGFYMISGSLNLANADREFNDTGREYILKEAIAPLENEFDYCIIDTPPSLSILTVNALTASSGVIVPMKTDFYSLQGLEQLYKLVQKVKKYSNPNLCIEGLLLTKYKPRAIINRQIKEQLETIAERMGTKVFNSTIREAIAIQEALFLQTDIFTDIPKAKVTEDYKSFVEEFIRDQESREK